MTREYATVTVVAKIEHHAQSMNAISMNYLKNNLKRRLRTRRKIGKEEVVERWLCI